MAKILIAGQDCTPQLRAAFVPELQRMAATGRFLALPHEVNALRLRESRDAADHTRLFVSLLRHRQHVDTMAFEIPRRPGWRGALMARVKGALWRLLKYQHDRVAFRQNLVNSHVTAALEFQQDAFAREIASLKQRVAELEERERSGRGGEGTAP